MKPEIAALSVGLPGRLKSRMASFAYTHRSRSRLMNSEPWSTLNVFR